MNTATENGRPLPPGWRWARLGDLCEVGTGGTPRTTFPEYYGGNIHWLRSGDIKGDYVSEVEGRLTQAGVDSSNAVVHPIGTVMIALSGQGKTRGTSAILSVPCACSQSVAAIRPSPNVLPEIVHFALVMQYEETRRLTGDNERSGMNLSHIRNLQIPLLPLPEQHRIAATLREQLDAVRRAREAALARLEAARALPAAFLRSVFESEEAKAWPRTKLGNIATTVQNGVYRAAEFYGSGVPFIRMYNIPNDHWDLDLSTVALVDLSPEDASKYSLAVGDLLISRVNSFELVGKCAWVGPEAEHFVFENMLIRVRLGSEMISRFMAHQMAATHIREHIEVVAKRAIGQSSINSGDIKEMVVFVPPQSTQRDLAARVDGVTIGAHKVIAGLEAELAATGALPQSLLRQAFAGKL